MLEEYKSLISGLPLSTVEYAFAYGSGALPQKNENMAEKMVDFIISTNNPVHFHSENIQRNPTHYSLLRFAGPKLVSSFQCNLGASVLYNTYVKIGDRVIKYGIISTQNLKQDLLDWKWMYIAGRLHKPVLEIIEPTIAIADCVLENRRSALQAAMLILPDSFSLTELYNHIVSLSYNGDFRMVIGEDKDKVKKIVDGNFEKLHKIYDPLLTEDSRVIVQNGKVLQDTSTPAIYHRLNLLPSSVLNRLQKNWNKKNNRQKDIEEVLFSLAHRHDIAANVTDAMSSIVAPASVLQTAKNAISAGFTRSIIYSVAKLSKMLKSRM